MSEVLRHLRATLQREGADRTDGQLLEDYVSRRDQAALEALVRRHALMVWQVCRRLLASAQDAEDAFQATFLVLVRRAASIRQRDRLASWLYGVARQTALKARATAARRREREKQVAELPEPEAARQDLRHDLRLALDQELARLPEAYRAVLVLCDLEGQSRQAAAGKLGLPEGTVASRLARARALLARRLGRGGPALPGVALPAWLVSSTVRAVTAAAPLTEGLLKAMLPNKLKAVATLLLTVALVVSGSGLAVHLGTAAQGEGQPATKPAGVKGTARLIEQLGSPVFAEREAAAQALYAIGEPALPALRKAAADSADLEIRKRARRLVREVERLAVGEVRCFEGHGALVYSVGFSADGRTALSSSYDRTVRLWDVKTGKELRQLQAHNVEYGMLCAALAPDGRRLLTGSEDRTMRLWEVEGGKEVQSFTGHTSRVACVAFSPDGRHALSAGHDGTVRRWDVASGKQVLCLQAHPGGVWSAAFSADGRRILSGGVDGVMRLWDGTTGAEIRRFESGSVLMAVAISRDGRRACSAGQDNILRLWDVQTGKEMRRLTGHTAAVHSVAISPDGGRALTAGLDRTVRLWDLDTGEQLRCFREHTHHWIYSVAFSPDGRLALSGGEDKTMRLWALPAVAERKRVSVELAVNAQMKYADLANVLSAVHKVEGIRVQVELRLQDVAGCAARIRAPKDAPARSVAALVKALEAAGVTNVP